jgi:hypothetical protein
MSLTNFYNIVNSKFSKVSNTFFKLQFKCKHGFDYVLELRLVNKKRVIVDFEAIQGGEDNISHFWDDLRLLEVKQYYKELTNQDL